MEVKFDNWLQRRYEPKKRSRIRCKRGDRIHIDYHPVYDARGVWHLEESGKTDSYLEIQSHAESCDINILMARYRNGEVDVLSRIQGIYGDVSEVPTNYAEIINAKLRAEEMFMGLSPELRESYGNSVEQFMASLSTKAGWKALGINFDPPKNDAAVAEKAEVKPDGQER